jgi:hypothetical protein
VTADETRAVPLVGQSLPKRRIDRWLTAFWLLACASPGVLQALHASWMVSPYGRHADSPLKGWLPLILLLAAATLLGAGLAFVIRRLRPVALRLFLGACAVLGSLAAGIVASIVVRHLAYQAFTERAQTVVERIGVFEAAQGRSPRDLSEVFPEGVPKTGIGAFPGFGYYVSPAPGRRQWELFVEVQDLGSTWQWLKYSPGDCPSEDRYDDWCLVPAPVYD